MAFLQSCPTAIINIVTNGLDNETANGVGANRIRELYSTGKITGRVIEVSLPRSVLVLLCWIHLL